MQQVRLPVVLCPVLMLAATVTADVRYTVVDLNAAHLSQPMGVNSSGHVVGTTGSGHLGLYANGVTTDLGFLPGSALVAPAGINDSDQITGTANLSSGSTNAFLYSGGTFVNLGALGPGGLSGANAINNAGQVVGHSSSANPQDHAFLYANGTMTDLGTLTGAFGDSIGYGINDLGQVVGRSQVGVNDHAFLYANGTMTDLGAAGGFSNSQALGISHDGDVVGLLWNQATGLPTTYGFLYHGGLMSSLGSVVPSAINSAGQIVGSTDGHAFLRSDGQVFDLNTLIDPSSGWHLNSATGISDSGYIIGSGTNATGQQDYFLLSPVPEPASMGAVCLAALLLHRRRVS